jgi:hypothetical protein
MSAKRHCVDMHVHVVGNGSGGTGCRLNLASWRKLMASFMVRGVGLPTSVLKGDLDRIYAEHLLLLLRSSSLSHALILAQDYALDEQGQRVERPGSFYVPNDYVLRLAREHPEFLPAVSIHPRRPDAMEELERCIQNGAAAMKCLPNCHNIDCDDRRFTKFWERMAEARLPLLAHTGGEHTLPVLRPDLADPRILKLPLNCGVTVIAAHCATKSGLFDPEYFHIFAEMTRQYPNLYGDNSAFAVPIRGRHTMACLEEPLAQRILHGSDVPVPVHAHWAWMRGHMSWKAFRECENCPNVLERDYLLKRAIGFKEETFTRVWNLLRVPTSQRPVLAI